ncbi:MAG: hypothetical protein U0359_16390 [Byssovorax sp.]
MIVAPRPAALASALAFASASLAFAPAAHAEPAELREPVTDLRLRLDIPSAKVCVVVPRESQREDDCEDLDLPRLEAAVTAEKDAPTGFAFIRLSGWSFSVMVSAQRDVSPRSAEQIRDYAAEVGKGAASQFQSVKVHGRAPGSPYDLETINGIHAIRFTVDLAVPKDPDAAPIRLDYGALLGHRGLALVAVVTDDKHAAEAEVLTRQILSTATMPHPVLADFGRPQGFFQGLSAGKVVAPAGGAAALIALVYLAFGRSRKKKRAAD